MNLDGWGSRKVRRALVLPDIHHPYQNKGCMKAIFSWLKDYGHKLDYLVLLGDQMDMEPISHWLDGQIRVLENKRLINDYKSFDHDILTPLERAINPKCKKVFFIGNHEDWVRQAIDRNPQNEGFWEVETNLRLPERGWEVIPLNGTYQLGKLWLMHGIYTNQYHARKMVDVFCRSIAYGHTHDCQEHTKIVPIDVTDVHKAKSIGCLCDKNPDYMKNKPNRWVHAFMEVDLSPNGDFTEHTINIINGKFRWNGKIYS